MMTDWMACVRELTHLTQIADLTRRLDLMSRFIHHLGRDPAETDTFDPDLMGAGSTAGLMHLVLLEEMIRHFIARIWILVEGILTQKDMARVDQFDDPNSFVNDVDFIC